MTFNLTAGNDTLDLFIGTEYALNGVDGTDPTTGAFLNLRNQAVDGLAGIDTVTSDKAYGEFFTLTATDAGVLTMTVASGSKTTFTNVEKFQWKSGVKVTQEIKLGTAAADTITGGALGDKFLYGLGGADTISGLGGADWLMGGKGADKLIGGAGADKMTGGADTDKDTFIFKSITEMGKTTATRDQITDFHHGQDKIDLSAINPANATHAFTGFTKGTTYLKAGEVHYTQAAGHTIVAGDMNGDHKIDFQIDLVGTINLTGVDFIA